MLLKLPLKSFSSGQRTPALSLVLTDHAHHTDDHYLNCPWEHSHWPSRLPWRLISKPDMGDATGDRQESDFHCLAGYCPADTTTLLEAAWAHIHARLVHPILCKYWLALLWKGSWSQTELSAFPCFSLFPLWQPGTFCSSLIFWIHIITGDT